MSEEKREKALEAWWAEPLPLDSMSTYVDARNAFRAGWGACAADNAERVKERVKELEKQVAWWSSEWDKKGEAELYERSRANALESQLAEARATIESQAHSLSVATEAIDRLRNVIDECFGMQPVMSADGALTFLEQRLFADRQAREAMRATIERVRLELHNIVVAHRLKAYSSSRGMKCVAMVLDKWLRGAA